MKKLCAILFLVAGLWACQNPSQDAEQSESQPDISQKLNAEPVDVKSETASTYLCKINGENWGYTKASGIVSQNKKTKKKIAQFTFKRKLDKGSESIMLDYDGDSFQLESASLILKFPKKGGGRVSGHYSLFPDTRSQNPNSDLSGTIDLSNPGKASGNAVLTKFNIKYEKELLEHPNRDAVVTITDLKFEGVAYSDVNKVFNLK